MNKGSTHSHITKEKMRKARKAFFARGGSSWIKGKRHNEKTKRKLRLARVLQSKLYGEPALGHTPSFETRLMLSIKYKGKRFSKKTEFKKKMIPWNKGRKFGKKIKPKGYSELHTWIRYHFGKAKKCENSKCLNRSKNYQWAKIKNKKYERKRENFTQLCSSCHRFYDNKSNNIQSVLADVQNIVS